MAIDRKKQKELLAWGKHEASRGRSLKRLETDLAKEGVDRASDRNKILSQIEQESKARERQKAVADEEQKAEKQAAPEQNKSLFRLIFWVVVAAVIGYVFYMFYTGRFGFEIFNIINFK